MASRVLGGCRFLMAKPSSSASETTVKRSNVGIMKPIPVSPAMEKFVGSPEVSRAAAIKKIWDYVKLNNLQNPANKKEILCDDNLKSIFHGKDRVGMLEISRLLRPHFIKSPNELTYYLLEFALWRS